MEKVNWLIEDFERDNSFAELADEVVRQGHTCEVLRYLPFITNPKYLSVFPENACVVFQGSIGMARQIGGQSPCSWVPGPIATWRNYRCHVYYSFLGPWLLNSDYRMFPFADFLRRFSDLLNDSGGEFFLRPDDGAKKFSGFVVNSANMTDNMWKYISSEMEPWDLVLMAPTHPIHREWRLVCDETRVLTGSRYKTWGQPDFNPEVPAEVVQFAQGVLDSVKWRPDPVFVMDICEVKDQLYVLEIGAFSVAGLYKCDLSILVKRVSEIAFEIWKDYHQ